jgi:glutathione S-transferase
VIAEYVDSLNDTPILIPRNDALARMHVKRWEALADGIMDSAIAVRNERLRPDEKQEPGNITLHNKAIDRALDFASNELGAQTWLCGNHLSLGDLALFSTLVYLDLRQPERDWRAAYPLLLGWYSRVAERPSAKTSLAEQ